MRWFCLLGSAGVRVLFGRWQDVAPQLTSYDGIFFDTYGEYYEVSLVLKQEHFNAPISHVRCSIHTLHIADCSMQNFSIFSRNLDEHHTSEQTDDCLCRDRHVCVCAEVRNYMPLSSHKLFLFCIAMQRSRIHQERMSLMPLVCLPARPAGDARLPPAAPSYPQTLRGLLLLQRPGLRQLVLPPRVRARAAGAQCAGQAGALIGGSAHACARTVQRIS